MKCLCIKTKDNFIKGEIYEYKYYKTEKLIKQVTYVTVEDVTDGDIYLHWFELGHFREIFIDLKEHRNKILKNIS